jgi:hypothetical protein
MGAVARMGETMEMGKCFIAKKAKIHDVCTIQLFIKIRICTRAPENGTKNNEVSAITPFCESSIKGSIIHRAVADEMSITGKTALCDKDIFLKIS